MATNFLTPNMNLLVPVVGAELSPTWAQDLNASLGTIDGHNHSAGSGVLINPGGLNINATLPINGNALTTIGVANISPQGAGIAVPVNDSIYVSGVDLYYQDGNGNAVRITSGGTVNATSSGISSGSATASFVSSILVVDQSVGVGAAIDAATYILRYNGSYPSPSGNYILLAAPSSLSGGYQLTFPATVPSASSLIQSDTSGTQSYLPVSDVIVAIASPANQLAILRGVVSSTGTIVSGEGFSITKFTTGEYNIIFGTAFNDTPALTVTAISGGLATIAYSNVVSTTGATVSMFNLNSAALVNAEFSFIAIGQNP